MPHCMLVINNTPSPHPASTPLPLTCPPSPSSPLPCPPGLPSSHLHVLCSLLIFRFLSWTTTLSREHLFLFTEREGEMHNFFLLPVLFNFPGSGKQGRGSMYCMGFVRAQAEDPREWSFLHHCKEQTNIMAGFSPSNISTPLIGK